MNAKNTSSTVYVILAAISVSHLLNDLIQSVIPSVYPMLKMNYGLSFAQIGLITLVFQLTASIFQPFLGHYTDKKPNPRSLSIGMSFTFAGLICLARSEGHTSELQSLMRNSYSVFCLKKKKTASDDSVMSHK